MTKQTINVGTSPNDNRGDSLRASFQKINANFTELYTALGLDVAPLNLGAFEFAGSVLSTTDSSAIVIDQAVTVSSNLTVGGDVLPSVANGGDLGSSARPWRSLYVSNNTIYIGGTAVGLDANGNLTTNGTVVGSTPAWANITGKPTIPTSFDRLVNGDYELVVETDGIISSVAFPERDGGKIYLSGVEFGAVPSDPADTFPYPLVLTSQQGNIRITPNAIQAPRLDWIFGTDGNLTLPGDIRSEGNINIEINLSDSTLRRWQFGEDGELTLPAGAVVKTTSGHLTIKGQSYVYIDSATNGQIEIGTSSGVGAVVLGSKSRGTNVVVNDLQVANGVYEYFSSLTDATGVVTHNCSNGHIFYHTSPDANWTVNLTNLLDTWNRATSVTLIIAQGATGYYPSAVQIAGVAQTIKWQGNVTPTPSTNRTDVVTFSIINVSGTYTVLGQLTGF